MTTTYEPGLYYVNASGTEVRKLLGEQPPQGNLFLAIQRLPPNRWAYQVIWSFNGGRQGAIYTCNKKSFQAWGSPAIDQDWWQRVESGEARHFAEMNIWLDGNEVVVIGYGCNECGGQAEQRFPAQSLRDFLGGNHGNHGEGDAP